MLKRVLILLIALFGVALSVPSRAVPQFTHANWTSANGVPGMISALAQTPDGYLWLATYEGLFRFDGVTFERVRAAPGHPDGAIPATSVFVTSRGELWVGYAGRGGVEVYRDGRLVRVPMTHPPGEVTAFREDASGAIYAIGGRQPDSFYRYWQGHWTVVGKDAGLPAEFVSSMLLARDGMFWIATRSHLLFKRPGATRFEDTGERLDDGTGIAEDKSGNIWISGPSGTRMVADYPRGKREPRSHIFYPAQGPVRRVNLIFDHEGALWGSTYVGGVFRINAPGQATARVNAVSQFQVGNGLTSNQAVAILEDREHNIWVATEIGLDQFRRANVEEASLPPRTSSRGLRMAADGTGAIHVANGDAIYRVDPGGDLTLILSGVEPTALCPDRPQGVWIATSGKMELVRGGRRIRAIALPGGAAVSGCNVDGRGHLWVARPEIGVFFHEAGKWRQLDLPPHLGRPRDVVIDSNGDPMVVLGNRVVVHVRPDRTIILDNQKLGVAGLTGAFPTEGGALIAGGTGLAFWNGQSVRRIPIEDQPWLRGIRGLAETKLGETWLLSNKGIYRVSTATLRKAFDDPHRPVPRTFFGEQDGLRSHTNGEDGTQALEAGDGRIWFLTRQGPVWIDPGALTSNPVAPTVIIRGLTSGDRHFTDPAGIKLASGTRNLSIDYTALSLSVPNRVAFRYKLEGVDRDWVDPGLRRQAFYTNLGPGRYRFHVIAANDNDVWNHKGAVLDFEITPSFTQSWLFYALSVGFVAGLLWVVYAIRVRIIANRLRVRNAERINERERIARELHDTLLQAIQALMLRFHVAAEAVEDADARRKLDTALDRAEEVLVEGRDRVSNLRQQRSDDALEAVILGTIGRLEFPRSLRIDVSVQGIARRLEKGILKEVEAIVTEALFNVSRHSQASEVKVEILFEPASVIVSVRDDGIGIAREILDAGYKAGHFGLLGMRERAGQIGGRLVIQSTPGEATMVRLTLPTERSLASLNLGLWSKLLPSRGTADVD